MPDEVILDVTTIEENVTVETTAGDVVGIQVVAPTGPTGATGPAGPNSVTSATTSDGTANLSLGDLEVVGGEIYTDGDYSNIYTQGDGAEIFTIGTDAIIYTQGADAHISTSGDSATIYTSGASGSIYTTGANAGISTVGTNATMGTLGTNATISTAGSAAHIQTNHASAAVKSTNFAAVESGGASLVDGSMQPCLTWSAGGRNLTIPSGTSTTFNTTSYAYGTGAAEAHRTALGLGTMATQDADAVAMSGTPTIDGVEVAKVVDPVRTTLTGNGSTSVYAIGGASGLTNPSALIVAIDGVLQEPTVDYGVGSGNITFTSPLPNGSKAVVISPTNTIQVGQVTPSDGSVTSAKIASGVTLVSPTITGPANLTSQDSSTADRLMNRSLSDSRVIKNRVEGKARVFSTLAVPLAVAGSVNQGLGTNYAAIAITAANTHSGYVFADLSPHRPWSGAEFNFARSFFCSGVFYVKSIGDQNGSLRFFIGTPASYRANQAALAASGLCLEVRRNGLTMQARLAYFTTTYIETAWVTVYNNTIFYNAIFNFVIRNTGNGNVDVYFLASTDTGSTKPIPNIDGTPTISITNGPTTSGGSLLIAAFCADSTLTPTVNNEARIQNFDLELLS